MTNHISPISITLAADPQTVFDHFVVPELLCRWKGKYADLDVQVGGRYRVDENGIDVSSGRFLVVDPPDHLVFTWGWQGRPEHPPDSSTVEIRIEANKQGSRLLLEHRDLPASERDLHERGWHLYLSRLAIAVTGADPGPVPPH